jgi:diadenosine tetraphosphate (Ap4A) HIT family hydrolase
LQRKAKEDSPENLIIQRGKLAFVILNLYPYTSGHVMVVPFAHKPNLEELDSATRAEMMELTSQATSVLRKIYGTKSFNIGVNIGEAAGAGVKEHVHIHIVPRWVGDTNFMSTWPRRASCRKRWKIAGGASGMGSDQKSNIWNPSLNKRLTTKGTTLKDTKGGHEGRTRRK